ncbi:MAG: hybrid sensor histidine kinase/response regulator [Ignavibacteriae bacterium]|nr:hybrid sensor histidine kinase/response regulator [Ignavibacteriota bacterium]
MKKILIIEDEIPVLENLAELISESQEFFVMTASDGIKGLELVVEHLPDLILCDIMMPGMDGYEVLKSLKQNEITSTIPFIFLTAKSEKEDMRHGMELGADDFITKPFTYKEVFKAIDSRLQKTEQIVTKSEQQLNELRINLATTLPHELRTPLNGILASSHLLIEHFDKMDINEVLQVHKSIYTSAKRLNRLITNYLTFAELELLFKDKQKLHSIKTDSMVESPEPIIKDIATNFASNYKRINDLTINILNTPINITQEHLYKICEELFDNALKFSKDNTDIFISSDIVNGFYELKVKDVGIGLSPEQISKIGAYVQFDRKLHEQQGSGLGLIIVKRILQVYDGYLEIESESDKYTEIKVYLRLCR